MGKKEGGGGEGVGHVEMHQDTSREAMAHV